MNTIIIILCAIIAVTWVANFFHKRKKTKEVEYNKKMRHFQELTTQATDEELILILIHADEYQPEFVELVKKELENVRNIKSYKDFFNDKPIEEIIDFCNQPKNYPEEFIELAKQELIERNVDFDFEEPQPLEFMEQTNCYVSIQKNPFEETLSDYEKTEVEAVVKQNSREQAGKNMLYGALWCIGGTIATLADIGYIFWGAIVFGGIQFFIGLVNRIQR